jgi:large subunit ribosomal protein L13
MSEETIHYIDGTGHVLGRLSSWIAQKIIAGDRVVVVNAQDLIISGRKAHLIEDMIQKRALATHTNPKRGPFYPRYPDRILRRTVRGMIPWKKRSGKIAFRKLSAYIDIPEELLNTEFGTVPDAQRPLSNNFMTVGELANSIGWPQRIKEN